MKKPSDPSTRPARPQGAWYGKTTYFGLHYDLHAGEKDTELGARCGARELAASLKLMAPDFVQTDCKGHPGYTSWFSKVPHASVSPGVVKDAMAGWRAATRRLGIPLHCHYSGIWDKIAGAKHPDWCIRRHDGTLAGPPFGKTAGEPKGEKMCPRGPYLEKLMLPQMIELIDRYHVDGFWIDGDMWAVEPCYCETCRTEFTRRTGMAAPPTDENSPDWAAWWNFTRDSFAEYVTRYCDAVHAHKPGVKICSNWLQTFRDPGEPKVPTDWISGDNTWVWGMDGSRCEARFLSTRGKPWDIMLWAFYCSHKMGQPESPWVMKPAEMLMQEAAVLLAFGGNVQIYENPPGLRNGQLIPWRMRRLGQVGRFVKARRTLCQDALTVPQVAVLHSEHHLRATPNGKNLMWGVGVTPVQGAVFSLLECHYGVDILDEWALRPRLAEFPVVVAPEQDAMSADMVQALKAYVHGGGRLLVSGPKALARFGTEFLGVTEGKLEEKKSYHVPADEGMTPLFSDPWRLLECTTARPLGSLGRSPLTDERLLDHPCAVLNRVGRGRVVYVPANLFRDFNHNRYPLTRAFIATLMRTLAGRLPIEVDAPVSVDVVLRRKRGALIVHLINRASGIPNQTNNGAIDDIPFVGPIRIRLAGSTGKATVALEPGRLSRRKLGKAGQELVLDRVRIHAAVVVRD
jgi:hypothetical protein